MPTWSRQPVIGPYRDEVEETRLRLREELLETFEAAGPDVTIRLYEGFRNTLTRAGNTPLDERMLKFCIYALAEVLVALIDSCADGERNDTDA